MPASLPPPSSQIPGTSSGSGVYVVGIVAFMGMIGGLLWWKVKGSEPAPVSPTTVKAPAQSAPPVNMNAPALPPPPPIEEEVDAGSDGGAKVAPGTAKGPCSGKCGDGQPSGALTSALSSTASSAKGCYNRALRNSEVSGSMTVSVQVGSTGVVCGASIINDSVHSSEISSCVLGRFRGKSFPPPQSGCVVVNIPIAFTIKQ